MSTLAITVPQSPWQDAEGNWQYRRLTLHGHTLLIFRKGVRLAVTAADLASYFGVSRNRFSLPTYAKRLGTKVASIQVGPGIGMFRNGEVRVVYRRYFADVLRAANVPIDHTKLADLCQALLALGEPLSYADPVEEEDVTEREPFTLDNRDLLQDLAITVERVRMKLEAVEKKLDTYAVMGARRNKILSTILLGLADVAGANLCTPEENARGRYVGDSADA